MTLAHVMLFCAGILTALGSARPICTALHVKRRYALIWIAVVSACLFIDEYLTIVVIALTSLFYASKLYWAAGVVRTVIGAILGGFTILGFLFLDITTISEKGFFAGVLAAFVPTLITRYRRMALIAGFSSGLFAYLLLAHLERFTGALVSVQKGELATAAISTVFSSCAITAAFETFRERRRFAEFNY